MYDRLAQSHLIRAAHGASFRTPEGPGMGHGLVLCILIMGLIVFLALVGLLLVRGHLLKQRYGSADFQESSRFPPLACLAKVGRDNGKATVRFSDTGLQVTIRIPGAWGSHPCYFVPVCEVEEARFMTSEIADCFLVNVGKDWFFKFLDVPLLTLAVPVRFRKDLESWMGIL